MPIDGVNDDAAATNVDSVGGQAAYLDVPDPTFSPRPRSTRRRGRRQGGRRGLVYTFEITGATTAVNPAAVPYYRDDACLDDGTGDKNVPRPQPGESSTDNRVKDGYVAYWKAHGAPASLTYADLSCGDPNDTSLPEWKRRPFSAAFGQHGIHFFATVDTDNAFGPKPSTELDGQQWRYAVPMTAPTDVVTEYGQNVVVPLQAVATPYTAGPSVADPGTPPAALPEVPLPALLPVAGLGLLSAVAVRRRRRG